MNSYYGVAGAKFSEYSNILVAASITSLAGECLNLVK